MGIDKITTPNYVNIVIDSNSKYLKTLEADAISDAQDEDKLTASSIHQNFETEEYYYEADDNSIHLSGMMSNSKGSTFVGINIPLSNSVLIDILQASIKKFNKLKTTLESLS